MSLRLASFAFALAATACTGQFGLNGRGMIGIAPTPVMVGGGGGGGGGTSGAAYAEVSVHVQFFGVPLDGAQDVVFVLDRSGSMSGVSAGFAGSQVGMSKTGAVLAGLGGSLVNAAAGSPLPSKLEAAQQELIGTLRAMPDGTRFNIIWFDDSLQALSPQMVVLEPRTRAGVEAFIRGIKTGGSTAAVPALELAYQIGGARIILLSDGLANTGGGADSLLRNARSEMQRGVRFDTVGLGIDQDAQLLQTLARESGGVAMMR
ncbi:MAG: VWA domain-containing protein [Myxococcales bacterium]|nr:VWA domain-containing protein [Myxococcales bacterium]